MLKLFLDAFAAFGLELFDFLPSVGDLAANHGFVAADHVEGAAVVGQIAEGARGVETRKIDFAAEGFVTRGGLLLEDGLGEVTAFHGPDAALTPFGKDEALDGAFLGIVDGLVALLVAIE